MFYDNFARACTEIKISSFKTRKWPTLSGFLFFFIFFHLSFSPFSDWPSTALASSSKYSERVIETGKFYHGVATCSHGQFCFKLFSHISEHFVHTVFQAPLSKSLWSGYHWNGQMKLLGENWRHANYRNTVIFFSGKGGEANVVSWRGEGVTVVSCRLVHHSYSMLKGQAPKMVFFAPCQIQQNYSGQFLPCHLQLRCSVADKWYWTDYDSL